MKKLKRKSIAALGYCIGLIYFPLMPYSQKIFAQDLTSDQLRSILPDLARAQDKLFSSFDVSYNYTTLVLPGYDEWIKSTQEENEVYHPPIVDKNGFNEDFAIQYKRSGVKSYLKITDLSKDIEDTTEYHTDGMIIWQDRHLNKRVNILSQQPILPILFDKLITDFPRGTSDYKQYLPLTPQNFVKLLTDNEKIEIVALGNGETAIQIIRHSNSPFQGMHLLQRLVVKTEPDFQIKSYTSQSLYRGEKGEHLFQPTIQVDFNDYKDQGVGFKLPFEIEVTEFRKKTNEVAKSIDGLISLDTTNRAVAIKKDTISVKYFNPKPVFEKGEIDFSYPPGTEIVDMYANRVYLIGDSLEMISKQINDKQAAQKNDR